MIAKLEKEPKEDAAEKAYCHEETAKIEARAYLEMGLGGVQKTLEVLHEYYGRPSVLLCNNQQSLPCISAGGSIIGILEVCESDFSKNLAAEEAQESDSFEAYEQQSQENKITKTSSSSPMITTR